MLDNCLLASALDAVRAKSPCTPLRKMRSAPPEYTADANREQLASAMLNSDRIINQYDGAVVLIVGLQLAQHDEPLSFLARIEPNGVMIRVLEQQACWACARGKRKCAPLNTTTSET